MPWIDRREGSVSRAAEGPGVLRWPELLSKSRAENGSVIYGAQQPRSCVVLRALGAWLRTACVSPSAVKATRARVRVVEKLCAFTRFVSRLHSRRCVCGVPFA